METVKSFASTTGLRPFSPNRISFILAIMVATLVIAKFIDAYIFCGFGLEQYLDLPVGIAMFAICCVAPLLGMAVNRKPTTKCGKCLNIFLKTTFLIGCGLLFVLGLSSPAQILDPFDVCGNQTYKAITAQFSNAVPTYEMLQRIDIVFKLTIALAWWLPSGLLLAALICWLVKDNLDAEHGATSEASDQPAEIDIDDESAPGDAIRAAEEERSSKVCSVDAEMENCRNKSNEPGVTG